MPRLRALQTSANHKAGEEFDASDADARLLCAPDGIGGQKAVLVDRAMRAETVPDQAQTRRSPDEKDQQKRRYLRRDLRAQT